MLVQTHLQHNVQLPTFSRSLRWWLSGVAQRRTALRALTTRKVEQRAHCALAVVCPGREQDFR